MLDNIKLNQAWIMAHIPHQGSMCLLDHVTHWDTKLIRCSANSHRLPNNPLRLNGQLNAACGIEYAAQAMAVHGALLAYADSAVVALDSDRLAISRPRTGFLVSVRGATLYKPRIDDIAADLDIEAICVQSSENNSLYQFTLSAAGEVLLDGRATVMFNADTPLGIST